MKRSAPTLLPLLRTSVQGEIMAWLFLHPDQQSTIVSLARRLGTSAPTVMREANRLRDAGLILETRIGATRHIRANTDTVLFRPLADLMAVTYGPVPVLSELLAPIAGIDEALIYGSWAARYHELPGDVPNDIDVLVVGSPDADYLFEAAQVAAEKLGREVNVHRISRAAWQDPDSADPFVKSVRERPRVALDVSGDA